jgi:hypothetical protein
MCVYTHVSNVLPGNHLSAHQSGSPLIDVMDVMSLLLWFDFWSMAPHAACYDLVRFQRVTRPTTGQKIQHILLMIVDVLFIEL